MALIERSGNIHVHTTYSDGTGDYDAVIAAARDAGLDFLIVTDHNAYPAHEAGWRNDVLALVGEEIHDPAAPHQNHFLAVDARRDVAPQAGDTAALVAAVAERHGLGYIAHPYEHSGAYAGEAEIDWLAWDVTGFAGIEIWNYMSEFKSYATSPLAALWYAFFPRLAISGPYPETLRRWDELLAAHPRRVAADGRVSGGCVAIGGGADAHATTYRMGPLRKQVFPLSPPVRRRQHPPAGGSGLAPRPGRRRRPGVRGAGPRAGLCGLRWPGPGPGIPLQRRPGRRRVHHGRRAPRRPDALCRADPGPAPTCACSTTGECVATAEGRELTWQTERPGAYRVEALKNYGGRRRGWIYANPIWLT